MVHVQPFSHHQELQLGPPALSYPCSPYFWGCLAFYPATSPMVTTIHCPVSGETLVHSPLWVPGQGPSELQSLMAFLCLYYCYVCLGHFPMSTAPCAVSAAYLELLFSPSFVQGAIAMIPNGGMCLPKEGISGGGPGLSLGSMGRKHYPHLALPLIPLWPVPATQTL